MDIFKVLTWQNEGRFSQTTEIFDGQQLYGRINFTKRGPERHWSNGEVESKEGRWLFLVDKIGLFKKSILIKDADNSTLASCLLGLKTKFELKFLNGTVFLFKVNYFSAGKFLTVLNVNTQPLILFKIKLEKWRWSQPEKGEIEVSASAKAIPELPLLIFFGRYLIREMRIPLDAY